MNSTETSVLQAQMENKHESQGSIRMSDEDGNASDCSDDEAATNASVSETAESYTVTSIKEESHAKRYPLQRLSSRYIPAEWLSLETSVDLNDNELSRIDDVIVKFPSPPTHIPRVQEVAPQSYSNLPFTALKAVGFGFGSLRRGVDKLGFFAPKK